MEQDSVHPKSTEKNSRLHQYPRIFIYYAKARSNVYIFALATMVSLILGTHANLDPIIAAKAVTASYFLALGAYVYNDMTDLEVDKINRTNRPSVTGKATGSQLANLVSFLFGVSLLLAASLNFYTIFISIFFILLGIAYSHQRFNLKDKFPLKTVVTASGDRIVITAGRGRCNRLILASDICSPVLFCFLFYIRTSW